MVNDRFSCDFNKITPEIYTILSAMKTNASFVNLIHDTHVALVAKRDIKKGEEIFVSYRVDYWLRVKDSTINNYKILCR